MVTSVSTLLDAARGDLVLRILGSSRHGQVVRVHSPKCTIGAGPRCTVRLRARGLYPLHCVILRGAGRTIIRRWAPDTLLNGQAFTDAPLVAGDRLSIGRLQFEVLPGELAPLPSTAPTMVAVPVPSEVGVPAAVTAALQARLGLARQVARQRVRRLVSDLRAVRKQQAEAQEAQARLAQGEARARSDVADRDHQVQELTARVKVRESELTHQIEQLRSDVARLESQRQDWQRQHLQHLQQSSEASQAQEEHRQQVAELQARQQQLQAECDALRQKQAEGELANAELDASHSEQGEELERQKAALRAEAEELETARHRWEAEQTQVRQRADEQAAELVQRQAELQAAVEAFEGQQRRWQEESERQQHQWQQQQEQWHQQQVQEEAALAERRQSLDAAAEQLQAERDALEQQRQHWEQEQAELPSHSAATNELTSDGPPLPESAVSEDEALEDEAPPQRVSLDSLELFRRLGIMPQGDEEPEATAPLPPTRPAAFSAFAASNASQPTAEHSDHDEESVDAYMQRLLQRVRGEASPLPPAAPERPSDEAPPAVTATPAAPETPNAAVTTHIKPARPVNLAPRTVAPEKSIDLGAMRKLANFSAQAALGQHAQGKLAHERRMKLAVVGVSLLTGCLLYWSWWFRSAPNVAFHAANLSFLIAVIWGVQYAALTGHMIVNRAGQLKWASETKKIEPVTAERVPDEELPNATGAEMTSEETAG